MQREGEDSENKKEVQTHVSILIMDYFVFLSYTWYLNIKYSLETQNPQSNLNYFFVCVYDSFILYCM